MELELLLLEGQLLLYWLLLELLRVLPVQLLDNLWGVACVLNCSVVHNTATVSKLQPCRLTQSTKPRGGGGGGAVGLQLHCDAAQARGGVMPTAQIASLPAHCQALRATACSASNCCVKPMVQAMQSNTGTCTNRPAAAAGYFANVPVLPSNALYNCCCTTCSRCLVKCLFCAIIASCQQRSAALEPNQLPARQTKPHVLTAYTPAWLILPLLLLLPPNCCTGPLLLRSSMCSLLLKLCCNTTCCCCSCWCCWPASDWALRLPSLLGVIAVDAGGLLCF